MNNESMKLSDGRSLGFRCLGDSGGNPLFFFHGTPGSRLAFSENDALARLPGVRLITPERPGYGISDPKPDRVLLDWAVDVAELADWLGIQTFAVAGLSGGGPHALACASGLADRVTMALLLSSPSPAGFQGATRGMYIGNRLGLLISRYAPWLVRRLMRSDVTMFERDPEGVVDSMARRMAPSDQELLSHNSFREAAIRELGEAYRQGSDGQMVDGTLAMTSRDWGFDLRQIAVPVYLWHGEDDKLITLRMAQHLMTEIPTCNARFVSGAGHLLTEHSDVMEEMRKLLCQHV